MLGPFDLDDERLDLVLEARRQLLERRRMQLLLLPADRARAQHVDAHVHQRVAHDPLREAVVAGVAAVDDGRDDRRDTEPGAPARGLRQLADRERFLARVLPPDRIRLLWLDPVDYL